MPRLGRRREQGPRPCPRLATSPERGRRRLPHGWRSVRERPRLHDGQPAGAAVLGVPRGPDEPPPHHRRELHGGGERDRRPGLPLSGAVRSPDRALLLADRPRGRHGDRGARDRVHDPDPRARRRRPLRRSGHVTRRRHRLGRDPACAARLGYRRDDGRILRRFGPPGPTSRTWAAGASPSSASPS